MEPEVLKLFIPIVVVFVTFLLPTSGRKWQATGTPGLLPGTSLTRSNGSKDTNKYIKELQFDTSTITGEESIGSKEMATRRQGLSPPRRALPEFLKMRLQRSMPDDQKLEGEDQESSNPGGSWITLDTGSEDADKASQGTRGDNVVLAWATGASAGDVSNLESTSVEEFMMAVPTISSSEVPDFCCWEDGWATRDTTEYESSSREVIADDEGARTDEMDSYLGDVVRKPGDEEEEEGVLYIGGIFELTNNPHSASPRSELDAALLAIRHVNEQRIVPGYRLHLVYNDSKVRQIL